MTISYDFLPSISIDAVELYTHSFCTVRTRTSILLVVLMKYWSGVVYEYTTSRTDEVLEWCACVSWCVNGRYHTNTMEDTPEPYIQLLDYESYIPFNSSA